MNKIIPFLLSICISSDSFSQPGFDTFRYGKMVKGTDTLIGYFSFSHDIDQNGQTVKYRESFNSSIHRFQSRKYEYFEADSLYMETFGVVPMLTGDVLIMIPRIVNGKIQLFSTAVGGLGFMGLEKKESFFIKKGSEKMRIKKGKFKKQMHSLIADDEALLNRIDSDELKYEDLIQIVVTYDMNHI
jgi:hypothetical protein